MIKKKKFNIPIFVVHRGCPHMCSFCNQKEITGCSDIMDGKKADMIIKESLEHIDLSKYEGEIAFFGGSFTAIDEDAQTDMLEVAKKYIDMKLVSGIRCSTRPDCIDEKTLDRLRKYSVTSIELGVQSSDEEVLLKNRRGHSFDDVIKASKFIKSYGFELGLQMMPGLFASNEKKDIKTAEDIISLSPDTVRIYPTVVVKNSELEDLYNDGKYMPLSLSDAVSVTARIYKMCREKNITVLRMGLMATEDINFGKSVIAGPFHPAFGEMVHSYLYFEKMLDAAKKSDKKTLEISVAPTEISKAVGQRRENIAKIFEKTGVRVLIKGRENVEIGEILW